MYPNNAWYEIVNDCSIHCLLQTNDEQTAKFFSNRSGEQTTLTKNKRYSESVFDIFKIHPTYTVTESENNRMVLTEHEILTMDIHDLLVVVSTRNIIKMHKYDFSRNPMSKEIVQVTPAQHMPRWKLLQMHKITPMDDYDALETDLNAEMELPEKLEERKEPHGVFYKATKSKYEKVADTGSTIKQTKSQSNTLSTLNKGFNVDNMEEEEIEEPMEEQWDTASYPPQQEDTEAVNNNPVQKNTVTESGKSNKHAFNAEFTEVNREEKPSGKRTFTQNKKY